MKIGEHYEHLKSGDIYTIVALGLMTENNGWIESVTYQSHKNGGFFTQKHIDFVNKFHKMDIK